MTRRRYPHRWLVICDDERRSFRTRSAARAHAASLNRHPANADIRRHGPYRNADGVARVLDLPWSEVTGSYLHEAGDDA